MDPDGDLTVVYNGFGSRRQRQFAAHRRPQNTYLQSLLAAYAAESGTGLTAAQITWLTSGTITLPFVSLPAPNHTNPGDIDSEIDEILINAKQPSPAAGYGFNSMQLGRLRAILEQHRRPGPRRRQRRHVFAVRRRPDAALRQSCHRPDRQQPTRRQQRAIPHLGQPRPPPAATTGTARLTSASSTRSTGLAA